MNSLACRVAEFGELVDHSAWLNRHRESCLRCQVHAARTHKLQRELRPLRNIVHIAPRDLAAAVMSELPQRRDRARGDNALQRTLAATGAVVAAAAGAIALAIWRRSHAPA